MQVLSGIKKIVKNPYYIVSALNSFHLLNWMPDKMILRLCYRAYVGKPLNLKKPELFTEKLQWLKLYNRNPEHSRLVDKYDVRSYIEKQLGDGYLVPLLGVWDKFDDIDFSMLPDKFVLKCTHDSGGLVFCKDKGTFDFSAAKKKLDKHLKHNLFWNFREYPYKHVRPRIICEEYMVDESDSELKDYKLFCFNGDPRFIQVDYNRFIGHRRGIYDTEWNLLQFEMNYQNDPDVKIHKPVKLNDMINLSKLLSKQHYFIRVDFYSINDRIYIGELTFFPEAGFVLFDPPEYDGIIGKWLKLPDK